jgi:hypothetical protein
MTARERADTSTRQVDLFAELLAEVVILDEPDRLVVAKLERDQEGQLWVTRLLGKRCLVRTLELATADLERVALAYNASVDWRHTTSEKETVRGAT